MAAVPNKLDSRPREWRRKVLIPARLRVGLQWTDVSILNISSRGLMIRAGRAGLAGSTVELHRGRHVITAEIVWREGSQVGLRSTDLLPVADIMSAGSSGAVNLATAEGALVDRRQSARSSAADPRIIGRAIEYIGVGLATLAFASCLAWLAHAALARPVLRIEAALSSN